MVGLFCSLESSWEDWGVGRTGHKGQGHCSMSLGVTWSNMAQRKVLVPRTEAATRSSAHDCCKASHMTVAKQVARHLGGKLATFP